MAIGKIEMVELDIIAKNELGFRLLSAVPASDVIQSLSFSQIQRAMECAYKAGFINGKKSSSLPKK